MTSPLVRWLASLSADELAAILARRPEVLAGPAVSSLTGLASRLQEGEAVVAAAGALPLPAVQVVEVLQALGSGAGNVRSEERSDEDGRRRQPGPRVSGANANRQSGPLVGLDQLAAALGRKPDDAELAATLTVLAQRALVWPDGDALRMAGPLWNAFEHPLHLGPPARRLFEGASVAELRDIAAALRLPRGRTRANVLADVCAALADGERVRSMVASAPAAARDLLARIAWDGPLVVLGIMYGGPSDGPFAWAIRHGLLVSDGWQHAQMPGEVGMALRGPDWRAPFDPLPPAPELVEVAPEAIAREAAAAATAAVELASALLGAVAAAPVALVKAGGVGSRELRRLAKSVGCGEPEVRLWLELAYAAGLVGVSEMRVLPTEAYDEWCAAEPAGRLVPLLRAWPHLPAAPLTGDGTPALTRDAVGMAAYDLRPALLQAAAELPEGRGAAGGLADVLRWRLPLLADSTGDGDPLLDGLWREAHLVGALAHGALTPLGRALLDSAPLDAAVGALLPPAVTEAVFQNDLTAVVPGTPAAALAGLLDAAAVRESGGGAVTWRFSAASVRAALDAGRTPDGLLADLRTTAAGGALPQVLEYLVGDVGRQHGRVRVRAVGCVVRADDPALLAEVAGARSLRPLGLTVLAPTVLASARPVAETLAALRAAGYAPSGEDGDGVATVERAPRQRVPAPRRRPPRTPPDPSALAERLLASYVDTPEPGDAVAPTSMSVARDVRDHAPHLTTAQRLLLIGAVSQGTPVEIWYTNGDGESSRRVIEPIELDGPKLSAWCQLRDDERVFLLSRIESVSAI